MLALVNRGTFDSATGGTFQSDTDGTFHSDIPGTFESDMDGTFKVLQSANGQVVSSDYVQTDTPITIYLDTLSTNGTYYLEIISDTWYAEGVVTF